MEEQMSLWSQIKEDFSVVYEKDPAIRSKVELFFNYPGLWAIVSHRVAHRVYKNGYMLLGRIIMGLSQMFTNIDIHPAATLGRRIFIDHGIGVVIGETAEVGNNVTIYQGVSLGGTSLVREKRHPTVKNGAVIGAGAKVLGAITIGENSKIGANSVVIKNVPDDSTAVGIPARVIQKGRSKDPNDQNKLPDIDKQIFDYLLKRVAILEHAIKNGDNDLGVQDRELEEIYQAFLKSMKD